MYKMLFVTLVICLFFHVGCDDSGNDYLNCTIEEMQDRFANTDCIANQMVNGCSNITCSNRPNPIFGGDEVDVEVGIGRLYQRCTVIDCETLECEPLIPISADLGPGFLTNLLINDINGLPEGILEIEGLDDTPFNCWFIANQ